MIQNLVSDPAKTNALLANTTENRSKHEITCKFMKIFILGGLKLAIIIYML